MMIQAVAGAIARTIRSCDTEVEFVPVVAWDCRSDRRAQPVLPVSAVDCIVTHTYHPRLGWFDQTGRWCQEPSDFKYAKRAVGGED